MIKIKNRFGEEEIYTIEDIKKNANAKVYVACVACLSVWTDALSYIERDKNTEYTAVLDDSVTDAIVLSCQVTDLSIWNDIQTMGDIHNKYPNTNIYVGGCLAQRFDIELPEYVRRLDVFRSENTPISKDTFGKVDYRKPFWNKALKDSDKETEDGNLFRHSYPIKVGAGCHGGCKYCTIRDTRGYSYSVDPSEQIQEFLDHDDPVIVCDSPSAHQILGWIETAQKYNKSISFRNVEPPVANICMPRLLELARSGLLRVFHCPIQTLDKDLLVAMGRDAKATEEYIQNAQKLRALGVLVATNIIVDYVVNGKFYPNPTDEEMKKLFDYYVWNPYFDGIFNINRAKERFEKYIISKGVDLNEQ